MGADGVIASRPTAPPSEELLVRARAIRAADARAKRRETKLLLADEETDSDADADDQGRGGDDATPTQPVGSGGGDDEAPPSPPTTPRGRQTSPGGLGKRRRLPSPARARRKSFVRGEDPAAAGSALSATKSAPAAVDDTGGHDVEVGLVKMPTC